MEEVVMMPEFLEYTYEVPEADLEEFLNEESVLNRTFFKMRRISKTTFSVTVIKPKFREYKVATVDTDTMNDLCGDGWIVVSIADGVAVFERTRN